MSKKFKSQIGLPKKMTPDDAYVAGVYDGIVEAINKLKEAGWDNLPPHIKKHFGGDDPARWLEAELL